MATVENLSQILIYSSGIFAGMNLGATLLTVPAILASNDPLPVWQTFFNRGLKIAVPNLLITSGAAGACFVKNGMGIENAGFLAAGVLTFSVLPFTVVMLKPINDRLLGMDRNEEPKTVKVLVKQWGKMNWVRSVIGVIVFGICVSKIGQS